MTEIASTEEDRPSSAAGDSPRLSTIQRSVPVGLLILAGPIIASMVSRTVMSFVDFVMVSMLGTDAQAAIMPAGILLFCVLSFGMGILSMVNTFVAQSLGRRNFSACSAYAWQGVYLSLVFGLVVLPAWFYIGDLFAWVGHAPAVQEMEVAYVRIGLVSVAPSLAAVAMANFFNGIHKPSIGLWAAIIGNLFNALANYALIFGHFGFPAMGIAGAAWGTAAASLLSALVMLGWMLLPTYREKFHSHRAWRFSAKLTRQIVASGLPAGVQFTADIIAFTIFTLLLIGRFGTQQLAAHNLVFKFLEISFMPTVGLGVAVTSAVGKAIGQGDKPLARRIAGWARVFAMTYMGSVAICYVLLRHWLPGLLSDDPVVVDWASKLLIVCAVFQLFDAMNIIHVNALRGAGDNHVPAAMSVTLGIVVLMGGGFFMALRYPQLGCVGPWLAAAAYCILLGVAFLLRWAYGPWEKIDLLDDAPAH